MALWITLMMVVTDLEIIQKFDPPNEGDYLQNIVSMTFDLNGNLLALDAGAKKIFMWLSDGSFVRSIGREGNGPGELNHPVQIAVDDRHLIVWQLNGRMTFYDDEGTYRHHIDITGPMAKKFKLMDDGNILIGFRQMIDGDVFAVFQQHDPNGDLVSEIKRFPNPGFRHAAYGEGNAEINAYMPDLDIQTWDRKTYIGFGAEPAIYQLDAGGSIVARHGFQIPTGVPSAEERERYLAMSFPTGGGRISLRDLPNLKIHFDRPKAYFTHFTVKAGKVLFLRTPIGSLDGIGDGYAAGDYFINDLTTGCLLAKGSFTFPEDSQVTIRDGQVIAAITTEESYDLCRLLLKNF